MTPSLERADRGDAVGRAADHPLGLGADGEDLAGLGVHRDDGRLVEHHAAAAHVDERVGGAEVDRHVAADDAVGHPAFVLRAPVTDATGDRGLPGQRCSMPGRPSGRTPPRVQAKSGTRSDRGDTSTTHATLSPPAPPSNRRLWPLQPQVWRVEPQIRRLQPQVVAVLGQNAAAQQAKTCGSTGQSMRLNGSEGGEPEGDLAGGGLG